MEATCGSVCMCVVCVCVGGLLPRSDQNFSWGREVRLAC